MRSTTLKCSLCDEPAVTRISYAKLRLCKKHFIEFIERRVLEALKRYRMVDKGYRVLVAVSGGKDSSAMLYILNKISRELGFEIIALHIDLGIGEYSKRCREAAEKLCKEINTPLIVLEIKELLGLTLPEIVSRSRRPPCSVCGLLKRYLINAVAYEAKADVVALGHHLDDLIPYILKNFILQNIAEISKLGPKTETVNGFVGRIRPLYEVSESEIALYAMLNNLPVVLDECPYSPSGRGIEAEIRKFINSLEAKHPGMKIAFARAVARNIDFYKRGGEEKQIMKCSVCGFPSNSELCSFCRLTAKVLGSPQGGRVRDEIKKIISSLGLKQHDNRDR